MTTEEKLGQLNQLFFFGPPEPIEREVREGRLGSILFATDPAIINGLQHLAVEKTRLHIPLLVGFDVIHGFRTIFPVPIANAASWDPALVTREQTVAAREARAVGINWAFAPMVDIARDPRWGRIVEGAGEDPFLGAAMAAAQVRGLQGEQLGAPEHVMASVKHFAGYGAAEGGRDYDSSYLSESRLRNVYLPPFAAAIKAGAGSLMSAYMDLNDVPAAGNHWLLSDLLRGEWGFRGLVVSDANAVKSLETQGFARGAADAGVRALNAGVDMEMAIGKTAFSKGLPPALRAGQISQGRVDAAVRAILTAKVQLGLFEHPYVEPAVAARTLKTVAHRTVAREAAEQTAVLLKNEGGLLPLTQSRYRQIAVLGPLADSAIDTLGSWAFQQDLAETVTAYAGIKSSAGASTEVLTAPGVQISRVFPSFFDQIQQLPQAKPWSAAEARTAREHALDLARHSDLSVLVLGERQNMSGEAASRESLELPGEQQALLESVVALGKPVVVVLLNGRPLNISWAAAHVPAILEAWYPGTQGGAAIGRLLFGEAVPGGKLPFTWPKNVGQIPIYYAHNLTQAPADEGKRYWDEASTPLFPFGFGLSYSRFAFSHLQVESASTPVGSAVTMSVEVQNTGDRAASEVAQLYIHQRFGSASRPVRELKGFQKVELVPHAKQTLRFTLTDEELRYWSSATRTWVSEAADFDIWIGTDSTASLHSEFTRTVAR